MIHPEALKYLPDLIGKGTDAEIAGLATKLSGYAVTRQDVINYKRALARKNSGLIKKKIREKRPKDDAYIKAVAQFKSDLAFGGEL